MYIDWITGCQVGVQIRYHVMWWKYWRVRVTFLIRSFQWQGSVVYGMNLDFSNLSKHHTILFLHHIKLYSAAHGNTCTYKMRLCNNYDESGSGRKNRIESMGWLLHPDSCVCMFMYAVCMIMKSHESARNMTQNKVSYQPITTLNPISLAIFCSSFLRLIFLQYLLGR